MKLVLILLSLTLFSVAAIKTVELMNSATEVMRSIE